jgi:hypothetical protein
MGSFTIAAEAKPQRPHPKKEAIIKIKDLRTGRSPAVKPPGA